MKKLLILLFSVAFLSNAFAIGIGEKAPDFSLPDSEGKNQTLSQYKGKFVVLEWLNHDCPFIKKHYKSENMQNLQKKYTEKGVVWLSVISSGPGKQGHVTANEAKELTQKKKAHPNAVLLDEDGKVGHLYEAKTTPHMFVVNPEGNLIYMGAIDDKPSTSTRDIKEAKNYVQMALDDAMAGKPVSVPRSKSYGCSVKYAKK